ncbi:unnamed protein product, partial [Pelagomonas calceolata]
MSVEVSANGVDFVEVSDFEFVAPLTASVIKPRAGPPGTRILLTGFHSTQILLHSELKCRFDTQETHAIVEQNGIGCDAPDLTGDVTVSVVANGTLHEGTQVFRFRNPLLLKSVVPRTSSIDGGGAVTVTGEGFHLHGSYECRFGDTSVKARRLNATQLSCDVPSYHIVETVYLSVVDAEARDHSSESIAFLYTERPHISLVIPDKAPVSGGVEILVHGRGLSAGLTCVFGEATSPSRYISEELLSCVAPASSRSGPIRLTLRAKDATKATTSFTYVDDVEITTTTPKAGALQGGTLLTIRGAGFENTTQLGCRFGSLLASAAFVSDDEILCKTPPSSTRKRIPVEITNDGTHFASSLDARFDYVDAPSVDAFSPMTGPERGLTVKLRGRRFSRTTVCAVDQQIVPTSVLSSTLLECAIPPLTPGAYYLAASSDGAQFEQASQLFRVYSLERVTRVHPRRARGGSTVVVRGANFVNTSLTRCRFGDLVEESSYVNATAVACTVPHGGEGNTTVGVASNGVDFVGDLSFSYAPSIVIEQVHPRRGSTGIDVVIHVKGSINNHATCTFGQVVVAALPQEDTLVCQAPALPLGSHSLRVAPDGGISIKAGHFTATEPILISKLKPGFVYENGGGVISVEGQGFTRGLYCRVGEMESMKTQHVSATELLCPTPAAKPGTLHLSLSSDDLHFIRSDVTLRVVPSVSVVSASPLTGSVGGGDNVKVTVAGLVPDAPAPVSCFFGALVVRARRTKDEREVVCDIPPHDVGEVALRVGYGGFGGEGSSTTFTYVQAVEVRRIYPARAPIGGSTYIEVVHSSHLQEDVSCRFRGPGDFIDTEATSINSSAVRCASPQGMRGPSYLTLRARTWETNALGFYFYERPIVNSVTPGRTPSIGNGLLSLAGSHFASGLNPRCRIGDMSVDALRVASTIVTCEAPPGKAGASVSVGLDVDGVVFGTERVIYYDAPELVSLTPRIGSRLGGTTLRIEGRGFLNGRDGSLIRCCFGDQCHKPRRALDDAVACVTPALEDHVEVALSLNGGTDKSASLPFRVYDDEPVLLGLSPVLGSLRGGTVVHIAGAHLNHDTAACRFAGLVVEASLVTASQITCVSPPVPEGDITVEVAVNKVDFLRVPTKFHAAALPTVLSISPSIVVAGAARRIIVTGRGFMNSPELSCRFGDVSVQAEFVDERSIACVAPAGPPRTKVCVDVALNGEDYPGECRASLSYASPPKALDVNASLEGLTVAYDTDEDVWAATPDLTCQFGNVSRPASVVDGVVRCPTPRLPAALASMNMTSVNLGVGSSDTDLSYSFAAPVTVASLAPLRGPASGNTLISVEGTGFGHNGTTRCRFRFADRIEESPATVFTEELLSCETPPANASETYTVVTIRRIDVDGQSDGVVYSYRQPLLLEAMDPLSGSDTGGTEVTLTGIGWSRRDVLKCRVGQFVVDAWHVSDGSVVCSMPPGPIGMAVKVALVTDQAESDSMNYTYVTAPSITSVKPARGPTPGRTRVSVTGRFFSSDLLCRFGDAPPVPSSFSNASHASCVAPPSLAAGALNGIGSVALAVSANGGADWSPEGPTFAYVTMPSVNKVTPLRLAATHEPQELYMDVDDASLLTSCRIGSVVGFVSKTSPSKATCAISCRASLHPQPLEISVDGQLFSRTDHAIKCVAAPLNVRAEPRIAPLRGSKVIIHGVGLASAPDPACKFGREIVKGKRVDLVGVEAVACDAPSRRRPEHTTVSVAADASALAFSPAVPFTYFTDEVLVSVKPTLAAALPEPLSYNIELSQPLPEHSDLACLFTVDGDAIVVKARGLRCELPASLRREGAVSVRIAANGVAFGEHEVIVRIVPQPEVFSLQPSVGPATGGNRVRILGRGLVGNTTLCKFGDTTVRASLLSMEELLCSQPPLDQGAYTLEVVIDGIPSNNGARFHAVAYTSLTLVSKPQISVRGGARLRLKTQEILPPARPDAYACRVGTRTVAASVDPASTGISCVAPAGILGSASLSLLLEGVEMGQGPDIPYVDAPVTYGLLPTSGPSKRRVVVSGQRLGGSVRCRFGAIIADALSSSEERVVCEAPENTGQVQVSLSIDSEPWFDVGSYTYEALGRGASGCHVVSMSPASGPRRGGTRVSLRMDGPLPSRCRFGSKVVYATELSSTEIGCDAPEGLADGRVSLSVAFGQSSNYCDAGLRYEYAPAPVVTEVTPSQGVARGDILRVTGQNFKENCMCRIGAAQPSPALRLSATLIECAVPSSLQRGTHAITASNNGFDFGDSVSIQTRGDPIQLKLHPRLGPAAGGTSLLVNSVDLLGDHNLTCVVGGRSTPIIHGKCASPPSTPGQAAASIHYVTGRMAADASSYYYHTPLRAASIEPAKGSMEGGTRVLLKLLSDAPSVIEERGGAYACSFGDSIQKAEVVDSSTIACVAPPGAGVIPIYLTANGVDLQRVGTFAYYHELEVNEAAPSTLPPEGGVRVLVEGRYLDQVTHCRFGGIVVERTHASVNEVVCVSPSHASGLARVGLSANGVDFVDGPRVYYEATRPRVDAVRPAFVAPGAPTSTIYVVGGPFAAVEGWRAELLIQGMEYDFDCAFANTTHIACAAAIEADAPLGRGDLHLLLRDAPASSGEAGFWVLPDISVSSVVPTATIKGAAVRLTATTSWSAGLVCDWDGVLMDAAPTPTGASCPVADLAPGRYSLRLCRSDCDLYGASAPVSFHILEEPALTRVNPSHITQRGGESVEIDGGPFPLTGLRCLVTGAAEVNATYLSSTRITCETPSTPTTGPALLKVSIDGGFHYVGSLQVTYHATPTLFGLEELGASVIGGRPLRVKGRGFSYLQEQGAPLPTCDFGFGAVPAVVEDDSTLLCQAPPVTHAHTHGVDVRLGRKRYLLPSSRNITVKRFDAIQVTKVDPPRGSAAGSYSLRLTGTGFDADAAEAAAHFRDVVDGTCAHAPLRVVSRTEAWVDKVPAWHRAGRSEITASNCHDDADFSREGAIFVYERALALLAVRPAVVDSHGGTSVLIRGVGFYPSLPSVLKCRFGPSQYGDATFVNSTTVRCVSPPNLRAGLEYPVAVTVDGKTYVTAPSVKVRATAAPRILRIEPSSAFAGASVVVEAAFDGNGTFYDETAYCRFGAASVEAFVEDDTHVSCRVPSAEDARSDMPSVSIGIVGEAPGSIPSTGRDAPHTVAFRYDAKPSVARVAPSSVPSGGGVLLTVIGDHFVDVPSLTCGFSDGSQTPARFVTRTRLACESPPTNASSLRLSVATNGADFGRDGASINVWPEPSLLSIEPDAGADDGGDVVILRGYGVGHLLRSVGSVDCVFGGVRVEATWLRNDHDDDAVACNTPSAHDVTRSPQMSRAVVPVRLAPSHSSASTEAVLSYTYVARPTIRSLSPKTGPARGGTLVTLKGANLNRTAHCDCRFGVTVVECASRTDRGVECVAPPTILEEDVSPVVAVALSLDDKRRWLGTLEFAYDPSLLLNALTPTRGPSSGGTTVTVTGVNFRARRVLSCKFDERVVQASFVSTESISCRAPPGHNTATVSISQNGLDYDGALQFGYYSTPLPESLTPERGVEAAGAMISVKGANFPTDESVQCKFGDDVVAGSVLTDSEVRCPAPYQEVSRDVQEVTFHAIEAIREQQTVDVVGRRARREVQELRVTAAGGARREDFVDLDVDLSRATAEVQTMTTALTGHRKEKQRISIALPPHRREVQRFVMNDIRRAYLRDGMRFCREHDFSAEFPETLTKRCSTEFGGRDPAARLGEASVHDYSYRLVFGPYATRSLPMDYEAWFLKESLEELVPFRDGVEVVEDGVDWVVTYPYTAGDVPAPLTEASAALNFLNGSNVTVQVEEVVRGIAPPTYRLEVEGSIGGGYTLDVLGDETVFIPYDATANEVRAAVNAVLDNELYGWTEVRERAALYGNHPLTRAWDAYAGHRGRTYDISFVACCRSAFGGHTVLTVGTTSLKGVSATVRVVSSQKGVETLSGTYQVSTDGGLTYSAPADVDGGASALETAIEEAIGRMADPTASTDATVSDAGNLLRGCGYAYDVEYPAGRDFPPLQSNVSSFDSPEAYLSVNTTQEGSQYEVWSVALDSAASGKFFLSYGDKETEDLAVGISSTELSDKILDGLELATTISKTQNDYRVTFTDALEGGGLEHDLRLGGLSSRFTSGKETLTATTANCTKIRNGRWNPLSGTLQIAMDDNLDQFITMPHDATSQHLERLFSSKADVFGRPSVSRSQNGPGAYTWSITFVDYAGTLPLLQRVGGTTDTYGDASVSYTRSAASGSDCCLTGNVSLLLSDGLEEKWLRDVPSSISEGDLQDLVDVAFGDAAHVNSTNVSRHLPYEPSLKVRVEQRVSGAATWRFSRTYTSPNGGWGNASVVRSVQGSLSLGTILKRKGAQFSYNAVEDGAQPEVQRIRFTSLGPPGGHWRLRHEGVNTAPMKVDASADEVRAALEAALFTSVEVSRSFYSSGHEFLVTFVAEPGDVPSLECDVAESTGPTPFCRVDEVVQATSVVSGGAFRLLFGGKLTEPLSSTASSLQIQQALEKLPSIGRVNVSDAPLIVGHPLSEQRASQGTSGPGGRAWRVEFNDHKYKGSTVLHEGDQPLLQLSYNETSLTGTRADAIVFEVKRGSRPGGTFKVRRHFGGWSQALDYGASEEELRYALEALDGRPKIPSIESGPTTDGYLTYTDPLCGDIAVTRTDYADSMSEGYRYVVTFPECDGDAPRLYGDATQLNDASVRIRETRKGAPSSKAAGQFTISYQGATTPGLQIGAPIEESLEKLPTVGDVVVSTHEDVDQVSYVVTFTSLGNPTNLGDLPLLQATHLQMGDAARVSVRKISTGCCDVSLSFNGQDWHAKQGLAHGRDGMGQVVSLHPASGPTRGGTVVTVTIAGGLLPPSDLLWCVFGGARSRATRIDTQRCTCLSPAFAAGSVAVEVSAHSLEASATIARAGPASFRYHAEEAVSHTTPTLIDSRQGGPIHVYGTFTEENDKRSCRFDVEAPPAVHKLPERFVSRTTKAYALNASTVACKAPPLSAFDVEDASVVRARVYVLENGVDPSRSSATLWYARAPRALTVHPSSGPRSGGSSVRITTDWNETEWAAARAAGALEDAVCDFGGTLVPASYASRDILECTAPSLEPKRALHTVEVSSAAITSSVQEVEVRLNSAGAASGSFTLMLEGHVSASIPINASNMEVQQALNALPSVGFVTVLSNASVVVEGGSSWSIKTYRIAFRTREGPTPTLVVDDSELVAGSVGDAVRAYVVQRGTTGESVADQQTIRIRQPVPSPEVQRISLEAKRSFGNERQRIYFDEDAPISDTWTITYASQTTGDLTWDASEDEVRQQLELLRGVGRVDVTRMPAGTRGFAWTVEFLDEEASYHAGLEEVTDAPTYETAAPVATPSQQPTISGRTDFRRPLLTVASSATVVVKRVRPRVSAPDGQFWLSLAGYRGRAGPLHAEASSDDVEAAIYDAFGITVTSKTTQEPRGWAWTLAFPSVLGDVPLLTVNENWYHLANVTVSEVKPGVKALDGGLVLTTGTNTSRTLPLADLTAYKVRRALEETLSLTNMVVVQRDTYEGPCSNSSDTCRGVDYRVTFPASLGDVDIVRA